MSAELDVEKLEQILERTLTEEEKFTIDLRTKGQFLQHIVAQPGWDVILEMLQSYVRGAVEELVKIDPSKSDEVQAQHAVAFAISLLYKRFVQDVDRAIESARKPISVMKEALGKPSAAPLINFMQ